MDRNQYPGRSLLGLPRGNLGPQELGLLSMALPPVAGDAVGLLADGMGYAQNPKSLTPAAGLLSLAGMVPGIPSVGAMKRFKYPDIVAESIPYNAIEGWDVRVKDPDAFLKDWASRAEREDGPASKALADALSADEGFKKKLMRAWSGWEGQYGGPKSDSHLEALQTHVEKVMKKLGMWED